MVTLSVNVINKYKAWSTHPFFESEKIDQLLVEALILSCVGLKFLEDGNEIDEYVMDFVKSRRNFINSNFILFIIQN